MCMRCVDFYIVVGPSSGRVRCITSHTYQVYEILKSSWSNYEVQCIDPLISLHSSCIGRCDSSLKIKVASYKSKLYQEVHGINQSMKGMTVEFY
jgi:hypothetical protein